MEAITSQIGMPKSAQTTPRIFELWGFGQRPKRACTKPGRQPRYRRSLYSCLCPATQWYPDRWHSGGLFFFHFVIPIRLFFITFSYPIPSYLISISLSPIYLLPMWLPRTNQSHNWRLRSIPFLMLDLRSPYTWARSTNQLLSKSNWSKQNYQANSESPETSRVTLSKTCWHFQPDHPHIPQPDTTPMSEKKSLTKCIWVTFSYQRNVISCITLYVYRIWDSHGAIKSVVTFVRISSPQSRSWQFRTSPRRLNLSGHTLSMGYSGRDCLR